LLLSALLCPAVPVKTLSCNWRAILVSPTIGNDDTTLKAVCFVMHNLQGCLYF
jgi:hypothetical protein